MSGHYKKFKISGKIFWSFKKCLPIFATEMQVLDRISLIEQKLECIDALICEVSLHRNQIATKKKPNSPFLKAEKTGFLRTRNDIILSYKSELGTKKTKNRRFDYRTNTTKAKTF